MNNIIEWGGVGLAPQKILEMSRITRKALKSTN